MSNINPEIFKAYDIRGVYGKDFDDKFAFELANKFTSSIGAKKIVVGRDNRSFSKTLQDKVVEGIKKAGADAILMDETLTPHFHFAVDEFNADGGIMITASHNPPEFGGFKIVSKNTGVIGGEKLREIFDKTSLIEDGNGEEIHENVGEKYLDKVLSVRKEDNLNMDIGIEASDAIKKEFALLENRTGINFNDSKDFYIKLDSDGDRINFFEDNKKINPDYIFLLITDHFKYENVVYDLRFSHSVGEFLNNKNIRANISKVGRTNIHNNMIENNADFGAEISGHYFFKEFNNWEAPEVVLLSILKIMKDKGKSLEDLIEDYKKYFKSDEINFEIKNREEGESILKKLKEEFNDGKINELDGITVAFKDWWFNARLSNTESVVRVVVEANKKDLLDEKVLKLKEKMDHATGISG